VTAFAPFSGEGVEPLDGRGVFVDMNGNGVWDERESTTEAWQRLGLLPKDEPLTTQRYLACVTDSVERLREQGFISDKTARSYVATASVARLQ
jgi:hypothetical protein